MAIISCPSNYVHPRDYLNADDLAGYLDPDTLLRLSAACPWVALDGSPCWPAADLPDLVTLLDLEGQP
jgi:hypothetical protein